MIYENKEIDSDFNRNFVDQNRRAEFEKRELSNLVSKSVLSATGAEPSPKTSFSRLSLIKGIANKMKRKKGGIARIRNRCVVSGKSSIIGTFAISRITFRQLGNLGLIPGLIKI
jgi:ribosomal protein S14